MSAPNQEIRARLERALLTRAKYGGNWEPEGKQKRCYVNMLGYTLELLRELHEDFSRANIIKLLAEYSGW